MASLHHSSMGPDANPGGGAAPRIAVAPLTSTSTYCDQVYDALKQAITRMNIYAQPGEVRLEERRLAHELGISRTPVRMAMALLEKEGIVRTVRHRGVFVVRKSKREIIEMVTVWAALESMAARLVAMRASIEEISGLRGLFTQFETDEESVRTAAYSETNDVFHQTMIRLSRCVLIAEMTDRLMFHIRPIRQMAVAHDERARHSIKDHLEIIEALERRDALLAEKLVRQHTLGLAAHIEKHCHFLD